MLLCMHNRILEIKQTNTLLSYVTPLVVYIMFKLLHISVIKNDYQEVTSIEHFSLRFFRLLITDYYRIYLEYSVLGGLILKNYVKYESKIRYLHPFRLVSSSGFHVTTHTRTL